MRRMRRHERHHVLAVEKVDRLACRSPFDQRAQLRLGLADDVGLHVPNRTLTRPDVNDVSMSALHGLRLMAVLN